MVLVASCYRNRDKRWYDGPLGLYADLAYMTSQLEAQKKSTVHSRQRCSANLVARLILWSLSAKITFLRLIRPVLHSGATVVSTVSSSFYIPYHLAIL